MQSDQPKVSGCRNYPIRSWDWAKRNPT